MGRRRTKNQTSFELRAFHTAHTILEASGLRYQTQQLDGLAVILMAYAEDEILIRSEERQAIATSEGAPNDNSRI